MNKELKIPTADALEQYRALLRGHGAGIAAHTAPPIARPRAEAQAMLLEKTSMRLPRRGDEGYTYSDLSAMFSPDLGVNIMRHPVRTDVESAFRCGLPNVSPLLGITVNDSFHPTERLERLLPQGITVTSFAKAEGRSADIIREYYGTVARINEGNPALVLNGALAQDGILVHAAAGTVSDKTIQLVNLLECLQAPDGTELPVLAVRRLLVVVEDNASVNLLVCDHDRTQDQRTVSSRVTEIVLRPGATLNLYEMEETAVTSGRYTLTCARADRDSTLNIFSATLRPGHSRNDFEIHLDAPGATAKINGLAIIDGEQSADNSTVVHHHAPDCHSDQTFKYLVNDSARGAFEGLIRVDHGASATRAYQTNRNIVASPGARMHTAPQLEIYCDDVKCSHGAATGQLDENALFYMRSRGIDAPEARSMLMNAFMADVIDSVELAPLRDRLRYLVERRLAGNSAECQGCGNNSK